MIRAIVKREIAGRLSPLAVQVSIQLFAYLFPQPRASARGQAIRDAIPNRGRQEARVISVNSIRSFHDALHATRAAI